MAHSTTDETAIRHGRRGVTASILAGAHIVRVHDVREMRAAADVADEILKGRAVTPALRPQYHLNQIPFAPVELAEPIRAFGERSHCADQRIDADYAARHQVDGGGIFAA